MKLHISEQVPLFISALTEPHIQIESTVTAYPYLLFLFFSFGKQTKKKILCQSSVPQWHHVPQPTTDLFSINVPDTFSFFSHNDSVLILHHTKCCIETPSFYKNISIGCIYFHGSAARGPASYEGSREQ